MGLLWRGKIYEVPGLKIVSPYGHGGPIWAALSPADYRQRKAEHWIRQIIGHTTKGIYPQHVIPGRGPTLREKLVADFWRGDPEHSAAPLVIGSDGTVACLADLYYIAGHHATVSNPWSVGVELYQERDGGIYEAVFDAADLLFPKLCELAEIPFQVPGRAYLNRPLKRMMNGGPDCVGVFGHRDNTDRRGSGDPGDIFFQRMLVVGAEAHDVDAGGDLAKWRLRQSYLNAMYSAQVRAATGGKLLVVDGIAGPNTTRAMRTAGFLRPSQIPV